MILGTYLRITSSNFNHAIKYIPISMDQVSVSIPRLNLLKSVPMVWGTGTGTDDSKFIHGLPVSNTRPHLAHIIVTALH